MTILSITEAMIVAVYQVSGEYIFSRARSGAPGTSALEDRIILKFGSGSVGLVFPLFDELQKRRCSKAIARKAAAFL